MPKDITVNLKKPLTLNQAKSIIDDIRKSPSSNSMFKESDDGLSLTVNGVTVFQFIPSGSSKETQITQIKLNDAFTKEVFVDMVDKCISMENYIPLQKSLEGTKYDLPLVVPPKQEDIDKLYEEIYQQALLKKQEAEQQGKTFGIIALDKHGDDPYILKNNIPYEAAKESMFAELIAIDVAKRLGAKTLLGEVPQDVLDEMLENPNDRIHFSKIIADQYSKGDMRIVAADPLSSLGLMKKDRELAIQKTIIDTKEPFAGIFGGGHLSNLQGYEDFQFWRAEEDLLASNTKSPLSDTHTILYINGANFSGEEIKAIKDYVDSSNDVIQLITLNKITYASNPENAFQAIVVGDSRKLTLNQIKDMAERASLNHLMKSEGIEQDEKSLIESINTILPQKSGKRLDEFQDIVALLSKEGNQLTSEDFKKEWGEFAATVPQANKAKIEALIKK